MENTNKCKNVGFSTILWAVIAAVLCAAPSAQADVTVPAGEEWTIDYDVGGFLNGWLLQGSVRQPLERPKPLMAISPVIRAVMASCMI